VYMLLYTIYSGGEYDISLIVAGIDTLSDRREMLMARFKKKQVLTSMSLLYCIPDGLIITLLPVVGCKILNRFTHFDLEINFDQKLFLPCCLNSYT